MAWNKYQEGFGKSKSKMKTIHFIGIAGSGASAAANIAKAYGYGVTGCDKSLDSEFTPLLEGIEVSEGHSELHLGGVDILAISPAILSLDPDNPEILAAKEKGIKVMTWQEFVGKKLLQDKFVIAVCGTHGKTTTTTMIAQILEDANLDPTVLLGAIYPKWGKNFRTGQSKYFVIEADEFNDNYLSISPNISVVATIEFDHPEYFEDFASYKRSFQNFFHNTKNQIIANLSDPGVKETLDKPSFIDPDFFKPISDYSKNQIDFPLKILGEFNKLNASAAFNLAKVLGISTKTIEESLRNFEGAGRRMEFLGEINGAKVYSDFGHHPTEIKVTVEALRQKSHDREIIVFFQPHMFSRTKALFNDFVVVFQNLPVKKAFILDIYPSREVDTGLVNSKELVEAINKPNVIYTSQDQLTSQLVNQLTDQNIVIFMGAGDIDKVARKLLNP